jgi:hypothetical protein
MLDRPREQEGEAIVAEIESTVAAETGEQLSRPSERLVVHPRKSFGLKMIFAAMLEKYHERSILALTLMIAQSFLYNGVFFTFGLILAHFYHVEKRSYRLLCAASGDREFLRTAIAGKAIRYRRTQEDDRADLWLDRDLADRDGRALWPELFDGGHANDRLARHLLLCLARGELSLSHGE